MGRVAATASAGRPRVASMWVGIVEFVPWPAGKRDKLGAGPIRLQNKYGQCETYKR